MHCSIACSKPRKHSEKFRAQFRVGTKILLMRKFGGAGVTPRSIKIMTKFQLLAASAIAALAAACAGTQSTQTAAVSTTGTAAATQRAAAPTATPTPATQAQAMQAAPQQQAQAMPAAPQQQAQATPAPSTTPATYTDAQLQSFARAAIEVDPISRTLATATPEQQAAATEQIRQILTRNNLDGATYNAIAAQAQRDPAFAQRITALNRTDQRNG